MSIKHLFLFLSSALIVSASATSAFAKSGSRGYYRDYIGISPIGKISDFHVNGEVNSTHNDNVIKITMKKKESDDSCTKQGFSFDGIYCYGNGTVDFTYTPKNGQGCHITIQDSGLYGTHTKITNSDCDYSFSLIRESTGGTTRLKTSYRLFQLKITDSDYTGEDDSKDIS